MIYKEELTKAMTMLAEHKDTIFLGQSVRYKGNAIFNTLDGVPMDKRIEMPVAEDMQLGISTGLSLVGFIPISIFPRMDFLICAMNQLVNHLDKIGELSRGIFKPKVIIRTMVGSKTPMDAGLQHTGDYSRALIHALKNIPVLRLRYSSWIVPMYQEALSRDGSTILIEYGEKYNEEGDVPRG